MIIVSISVLVSMQVVKRRVAFIFFIWSDLLIDVNLFEIIETLHDLNLIKFCGCSELFENLRKVNDEMRKLT